MTYQEILDRSRDQIGPFCKSCKICNGMACKNTVPGPGAKGLGTGFIRNYQKWQELCVNMDTICENVPVDTSYNFFGKQVALPVFAAPVGAMQLHYGDKYDDLTYNDILVSACAGAGIAAFTGDGTNPAVMEGALHAIAASGGAGIPTVKPWNMETVFAKLDAVRQADPVAVAMDIDAAGLPFLKGLTPPAGSKTVEELRQIGPKSVLITSIPIDGQPSVIGYNHLTDTWFTHAYTEIPVHFPGTGDIFSAILIGHILNGTPLEASTRRAMDGVYTLIDHNKDNEDKLIIKCKSLMKMVKSSKKHCYQVKL